MQTIYFEVHKNSLSISKTISTITSGNVNYIELHFTFDSDWMSLSKTALFFNTDRAEQQQVLLTGDTCMIPHELTQQPGDVAFGLVGIAGDTRATTNIYTIKIKQGAYIEGETPPSPSVDIYQQIVNKMQAVLDGTSTAAATATEKAQEAEASRTAAETAAAQAEADREAVGQVKIDVATIAGQVREDSQFVAADKANVSSLSQIVQESADKVNRDLTAVQRAAADTEANAREAQAAQASAVESKNAAETAAAQTEKDKETVSQFQSEVMVLAEQAQKDAQTALKSKQDAQTAATAATASQTEAKGSENSAASSASSALQAKQTVDTLAQQAAEYAQTAQTEAEKATAEAERIAALDTYSKTEARMRFAPVIEERVEGPGTVHITNPVAQTTLLSCSMFGNLTETLADPSQEKSPDNPSTIFGVGQGGSVHLAMGSKTYEIPLDQPLYALPDGSRDEITADGKFVNRVGKMVLDGSRQWAVYETEDKNYCQAYIIAMDDIGGDNGKIDEGRIFCVSDLLPCYGKIRAEGEHITTWEWYAMRPGMGRLDIRVLASRLASPDDAGLRAWLAEHPITVYYLRQSPVISEVPLAAEVIKAIAAQEGDLSCTDPVQPYLSISYPIDAKSYIDQHDQFPGKKAYAYTKTESDRMLDNKADQPWVTTFGNPLILLDSAKGPVRNLVLTGNTLMSGDVKQEVVSPIKLVSCGKNLLDVGPVREFKRADVTFTVRDDGSIAVSGQSTSTDGYSDFYFDNFVLPSGTYTASERIYLQPFGGRWCSGTFTITETANCRVMLRSQVGDEPTVRYPQIELGEALTDFESYCGVNTIIPLLPADASVSDPLTLSAKDVIRKASTGFAIVQSDGTEILLCEEAQAALNHLTTHDETTLIYHVKNDVIAYDDDLVLPLASIQFTYRQNLKAYIKSLTTTQEQLETTVFLNETQGQQALTDTYLNSVSTEQQATTVELNNVQNQQEITDLQLSILGGLQ